MGSWVKIIDIKPHLLMIGNIVIQKAVLKPLTLFYGSQINWLSCNIIRTRASIYDGIFERIDTTKTHWPFMFTKMSYSISSFLYSDFITLIFNAGCCGWHQVQSTFYQILILIKMQTFEHSITVSYTHLTLPTKA